MRWLEPTDIGLIPIGAASGLLVGLFLWLGWSVTTTFRMKVFPHWALRRQFWLLVAGFLLFLAAQISSISSWLTNYSIVSIAVLLGASVIGLVVSVVVYLAAIRKSPIQIGDTSPRSVLLSLSSAIPLGQLLTAILIFHRGTHA